MEFAITIQPLGTNVPPNSTAAIEVLGLPASLNFTFLGIPTPLPAFELVDDTLDLEAPSSLAPMIRYR
jgi:hypothetical protein